MPYLRHTMGVPDGGLLAMESTVLQYNIIPESHREQDLTFVSLGSPQQTFPLQNTLQYIAWSQPWNFRQLSKLI